MKTFNPNMERKLELSHLTFRFFLTFSLLFLICIIFEIQAEEKSNKRNDISDYDNFRGEWYYSEDSKVILSLDFYNGTIFGKKDVEYVYRNGSSTRKKAEYYFIFDKQISKDEFSGKLETFDSYYGCFFSNGRATIKFVNQNELQIAYNLVAFDVPNYHLYNVEKQECHPRYCYSYYYSYYFICGYECNKKCKNKNDECKVTHRILVSERYYRKNSLK